MLANPTELRAEYSSRLMPTNLLKGSMDAWATAVAQSFAPRRA